VVNPSSDGCKANYDGPVQGGHGIAKDTANAVVMRRKGYSAGMTKPSSHHRGLGLDPYAANANPEQRYLKYWSFANFGTFRVLEQILSGKK
jgi:hypothetical protein